MNIKDAKLQIKNAMIAYFTKDDSGEYIMPTHKQRPVFLMGPPGIGKTAIMEQVASEMGVGLLSYSMTHHTRQSALLKALYLSAFEATKKWTMPIHNWDRIYGELSIMYEGRLPD